MERQHQGIFPYQSHISLITLHLWYSSNKDLMHWCFFGTITEAILWFNSPFSFLMNKYFYTFLPHVFSFIPCCSKQFLRKINFSPQLYQTCFISLLSTQNTTYQLYVNTYCICIYDKRIPSCTPGGSEEGRSMHNFPKQAIIFSFQSSKSSWVVQCSITITTTT